MSDRNQHGDGMYPTNPHLDRYITDKAVKDAAVGLWGKAMREYSANAVVVLVLRVALPHILSQRDAEIAALHHAVSEAYQPEGEQLWWATWSAADPQKRARMESGVLQEWSGREAVSDGR